MRRLGLLVCLAVGAADAVNTGQEVPFDQWLYQNRDFMEITILSRPGVEEGSDPELARCGDIYKNSSLDASIEIQTKYNNMEVLGADPVLPTLTVGWETCTEERFEVWEYFVRYMVDPAYNGNVRADSKPDIVALADNFRFVLCNQISASAADPNRCAGVSELATTAAKFENQVRKITCSAFSNTNGELDSNLPFADAKSYVINSLTVDILECEGSPCSFLDKLSRAIDTDNVLEIDTNKNELSPDITDSVCYGVALGNLEFPTAKKMFMLAIDETKFRGGNGTFPQIKCTNSNDCGYTPLVPRVCVGKDAGARQCVPCPYVNTTDKNSYQAGSGCQAGNLQYCMEGFNCKGGLFCADATQGRLGNFRYPTAPDGVCTSDGFCEELGGDPESQCAAESQLAAVYFYSSNGNQAKVPCLGDGVLGEGFDQGSSAISPLNAPFAKLVLPYDCGNGTNMKRVLNLVNTRYTEDYETIFTGTVPAYTKVGYSEFYNYFCVGLPVKSIGGEKDLLHRVDKFVTDVIGMDSRIINISDRAYRSLPQQCGVDTETAWCVSLDTCTPNTGCQLEQSTKRVLGGIQVVPGNSLRLSFYPGGDTIELNDKLYANKTYWPKLFENNKVSVVNSGQWVDNIARFRRRYIGKDIPPPPPPVTINYRQCPDQFGYAFAWESDTNNYCCFVPTTPSEPTFSEVAQMCPPGSGVYAGGAQYKTNCGFCTSDLPDCTGSDPSWVCYDANSAEPPQPPPPPPPRPRPIPKCPLSTPYPYDGDGVIGGYCCSSPPTSSGADGPNLMDLCATTAYGATCPGKPPCLANVLIDSIWNWAYNINASHWCPFEAPFPYLSSSNAYNANNNGDMVDPTRAADKCCSVPPVALNTIPGGAAKCEGENVVDTTCLRAPCYNPNYFIISGGMCPQEFPYSFEYALQDGIDKKSGCCQLKVDDTHPYCNRLSSNASDGVLCSDMECEDFSSSGDAESTSQGKSVNGPSFFQDLKPMQNVKPYANSCTREFPYAFAWEKTTSSADFVDPGCQLYCGKDPKLEGKGCDRCCPDTLNGRDCDAQCQEKCEACKTLVQPIMERNQTAPFYFGEFNYPSVRAPGFWQENKLYNYGDLVPSSTDSKSWRTVGQLPMTYMGAFRNFILPDENGVFRQEKGGQFFLPKGVDGINVGGEAMATQSTGCAYMRPVLSNFQQKPTSPTGGPYARTCPYDYPYMNELDSSFCCAVNCVSGELSDNGCDGKNCPESLRIKCNKDNPAEKCLFYGAHQGQCSGTINVDPLGFAEPLKDMYGEMLYREGGSTAIFYHGTRGGPQSLNPYVLNSVDVTDPIQNQQNPCTYGTEFRVKNRVAPPPLTLMFPEFCYAISREEYESNEFFKESGWTLSTMQLNFLERIQNLQGFETLIGGDGGVRFIRGIKDICEPLWNNDFENDLVWQASVSLSPPSPPAPAGEAVPNLEEPQYFASKLSGYPRATTEYETFTKVAARVDPDDANVCPRTDFSGSCQYLRGLNGSGTESFGDCGDQTRVTKFSAWAIKLLSDTLEGTDSAENAFGLNDISFYGITGSLLRNLSAMTKAELDAIVNITAFGGSNWSFFPQFPQGAPSKNALCFNYGVSAGAAVSSGLVSLYQANVVPTEAVSTSKLNYSFMFQENAYEGGFECLQTSEGTTEYRTHDFPVTGAPAPLANLIRVNSEDPESACFCDSGGAVEDSPLAPCDYEKATNDANDMPPAPPPAPTLPPTPAPTPPAPTPKPTSLGDIIRSENDQTTREIGLLAAVL